MEHGIEKQIRNIWPYLHTVMELVEKRYILITQHWGGEDGEVQYDIIHDFKAEDDPRHILEALAGMGYSWEIARDETRIIEISGESSGKELLKDARLKISHDYKLIPEDAPDEEPEVKLDSSKIEVSVNLGPRRMDFP